jgi:hypothetical protein
MGTEMKEINVWMGVIRIEMFSGISISVCMDE